MNPYIAMFKDLKDDGVLKKDAMDCFEFDSDEYPNMEQMKSALNEVYGE